MTNEQQRIAIAEFCGWKLVGYGEACDVIMDDPQGIRCFGSAYLSNYLNDLNAMHEAEKLIHREKRLSYRNYLARITTICRQPRDKDQAIYYCNENEWSYINATASQRAEALLRTIGKWKERDDKDDSDVLGK